MFSRQIYDPLAYRQDLYESTKPLDYLLLEESTYRGKNATCFQEIPEMHADNKTFRISNADDMVNIESDLMNLNRPNTKNPQAKYPFIKPGYSNPPGPLRVCHSQGEDFNIVYPKLDGTQFNRSKQIHVQRFESLCLNPQKMNRIRSNNVIGLDTRLYNRDTHKSHKPTTTNKTNSYVPGCTTCHASHSQVPDH